MASNMEEKQKSSLKLKVNSGINSKTLKIYLKIMNELNQINSVFQALDAKRHILPK